MMSFGALDLTLNARVIAHSSSVNKQISRGFIIISMEYTHKIKIHTDIVGETENG